MEHTRTITREFETGAKAVLHIEARSGAVVVESHVGDNVQVEATVHVWSDMAVDADEAATLVARGMEQDAHRVIIRAPSLPQTEGWSLWGGKRGSRVDYSVRVPKTTAVRVLARSGSIRVANTDGRVHVECGSGRCSATDIAGDVTMITRSGPVGVERVRGDVRVEARSGRVEVRGVSGAATLSSRSGALDARDVGGDVSAQANTGTIVIERAGGAVHARAHTGTIRYNGAVAGDFDMEAHTGMIHLAVDPEHAFFIDAESRVGNVRSELPPRRGGGGAPAGNGSGPKVKLRTQTGSIRISRL